MPPIPTSMRAAIIRPCLRPLLADHRRRASTQPNQAAPVPGRSGLCEWRSFACAGPGVPVHDYAGDHGGNRADR